MKKILNIIFSPRTTLGLLVIFAIALAAATFIEDKYDTATAKIMVYNAKWFELVMILMIFNFLGSIKRYQFLTWKKAPGLIFHGAFILMIIGAGITRYVGFEGSMHIREGATSNFIYSSESYMNVKASDGVKDYHIEEQLFIGQNTDNSFEVSIDSEQKGSVKIAYKDHIVNAIETFEEGKGGNINLIEISISEAGHGHNFKIREGEMIVNHDIPISYNNNSNPNAIQITGKDGDLFISYPAKIKTSTMQATEVGEIAEGSLGKFELMHIYEPEGTGFTMILNKIIKNAKSKFIQGSGEQQAPNALILDVAFGGKTQEVVILGGSGYIDNYHNVVLEGMDLNISYGAKKIELPFSLQLNKFELERYAGSMSPSSYASEVTLIDPPNGIRKDHRIFMNNVLDYGGYRFFQSSYDQDEKGTVLSVNHDFWGTWVTYLSYALMIIGFIWVLFNKHSRYWDLMGKIRELRLRRKALTIMVLTFLVSGNLFAQEDNHQHQDQHQQQHESQHQHPINSFSVSEAHADKFGEVIVQNYEGRFSPVHTLAADVMHKISKKDNFDVPGRGKMSAMQVFLDIPLNAEFWKHQKIIYVREKSVADILGISGKYVSFGELFNEKNEYKLAEFSESAFRKKDAERNTFDKEIIKLTERAEVFMMTYLGSMLDIFPVQKSENNKWVSWDDELALIPLTGSLRIINDDLRLAEFNYTQLMSVYFQAVYNATSTADYSKAEKILGHIKNIQRQSSAAAIIPSPTKIEKEISYNKSNIFGNLKNVYALLSVLLLILTFIDNLKSRKNKVFSFVLNTVIAVLAVAFIYHTYGMGMRWYLSGHAPWSNGYEALILIAWSSLLAGFSFMRYSKITLAATTLLAFFTLMTASHSNYDPQLTNLQPVLKSYWLIIHVATLTISYGFFGLAFFLGLFNMGIYLMKTPKNETRLSLITRELTYINEMNITIGLLLATIGTFLGGVWANESWGRYWGWDAKETWALVITVVYTIIIHLRLAPKVKGEFIFNAAAILGFSSVLMTFFGVNYYFTKGMHSYANGDTPVFPMWAWITIFVMVGLIVAAGIKERYSKKMPLD